MKPTTTHYFRALPMPQRPLNPSPLEMVIYNYELKARAFHIERNKVTPANECEKAKKARIAKSERDQQHLRIERRKIGAQVKLHEHLQAYRDACATMSQEELAREKHHPTKTLRKNLFAAGEPKPSPIHEAHHIIPGKGRYLQYQMMICRLNLHSYGIGIHDPLNGMWLRNYEKNKPDDWATPEASGHRSLHCTEYERWISRKFMNDNVPDHVFVGWLKDVKRQLRYGVFSVDETTPGGDS